MIYATESLAYYFNMKPFEFWNSRYSEINIYCQTHLAKNADDLKREINLQEAVTNKLIRADSLSRNPKIIPIRDNYKNLFQDEEKKYIQSPEEITKKMRLLMIKEKK